MTDTTSGERTELLRKWLLDTSREIGEIADDTDIIDSRILTSLQFVEFILYVEEVRGSPIDFDELDLDSVRTLRDIEKHHLGGTASG